MNAPYHNKALPPGTVLREWRLEEVLGVGGFGIVYRGKDVYFGETVAIKEYFPGAISDRVDGTTVAPTDSSSEEIYELGRQKFLEEAKVLWNLSKPERHPNVVSVRSLFEIHGTAYMVMDFESGVSLSQMLRDGKTFDEKSLMALIRPIAEGLDRAHTAGVLHRDIKPANILVNQSGRPVLIDFGSARFESNQATNTKVTFYTPPYAALEQYVKSYPQGPWTDIYALGVVMYQCITGEKPPEVLERLHGDASQELSTKDWPGYSRVFTRAVDAAMAIRPIERPNSISAWLKQFDLPDQPVSDEATRIGTPLSVEPPTITAAKVPAATVEAALQQPVAAPAPAPIVAPTESKPAPAPAAAAPITAPAKKPAQRRKTGPLVLASLAGLAVLGGGAAFLGLRHPSPPPPPQPTPVAQATPKAVPGPAAFNQMLGQKMDGLIATAGKISRPQKEIAGLTDDKAKLTALAGSFKSDAGKAPQDAAVLAQLNGAVGQVFRDEATALGRSEKRLLKDFGDAPDTQGSADAARSLAAFQKAKTVLDASLAADVSHDDAVQTIDATTQMLSNYGALQDAGNDAATVYISARRKDFAALNTSVQTVAGQVAALANVSKPWLLASSARKKAYQLRQDNAAQAKTLSGQISGLSAKLSASNDLKQLAAGVAQATTAKKTMDGLLAASNAAAL